MASWGYFFGTDQRLEIGAVAIGAHRGRRVVKASGRFAWWSFFDGNIGSGWFIRWL